MCLGRMEDPGGVGSISGERVLKDRLVEGWRKCGSKCHRWSLGYHVGFEGISWKRNVITPLIY